MSFTEIAITLAGFLATISTAVIAYRRGTKASRWQLYGQRVDIQKALMGYLGIKTVDRKLYDINDAPDELLEKASRHIWGPHPSLLPNSWGMEPDEIPEETSLKDNKEFVDSILVVDTLEDRYGSRWTSYFI